MTQQKQYSLNDQVIGRIAQILQEGLLLGVDVVDIMRQIRVTPDNLGTGLDLTDEYVNQVREMHKKLLAQAEEIQAERRSQEKPSLLV